MLDDIPAPLVLQADRVSRDDREDMTAEDHRSQAQLLEKALQESCAYAQQLWNDLAAARKYLYDSLPAQPSGSGAAPHGAQDSAGWDHWEDAFAEITSILCGPHGDSGLGRSSATVLAQPHREFAAVIARDDAAANTADANDAHPDAAASPPDDPPPPRNDDGAATSERPAGHDRPVDRPAPAAVADRAREPVLFATLGAAVTAYLLRRRSGGATKRAGSRTAR